MSSPKRTVRYAVVGLGRIAQVAVLPAFAHARRNSRLVTVVSDDRAKRREIAKRHRLDRTFTYEQFDECLADVDAVYIALPNSMHAEYSIRAGESGRPRALRKADGGDGAGVSADDRRVPEGRGEADGRVPPTF